MDIKVLGTGCSRCEQTEKLIRETIAQMKVNASVEKVGDIAKIVEYGVLGVPAVVIDGKVVSTGKVPTKETIQQWLSQS
jgi:small redox-active disulfide protein 2